MTAFEIVFLMILFAMLGVQIGYLWLIQNDIRYISNIIADMRGEQQPQKQQWEIRSEVIGEEKK